MFLEHTRLVLEPHPQELAKTVLLELGPQLAVPLLPPNAPTAFPVLTLPQLAPHHLVLALTVLLVPALPLRVPPLVQRVWGVHLEPMPLPRPPRVATALLEPTRVHQRQVVQTAMVVLIPLLRLVPAAIALLEPTLALLPHHAPTAGLVLTLLLLLRRASTAVLVHIPP